MDRRSFIGLAVAAFAGSVSAQQGRGPLDPVKRVYDLKVKAEQRPFSARLKRLYAAARKKSKALGEPVAGLDFEPIISGQDYDDDFRKSLKYAVEPRGESNALVIVKLRQFKNEPEITLFYDVVLDGHEWKIDDISNPAKENGWRWSTLLEAGAKGQ